MSTITEDVKREDEIVVVEDKMISQESAMTTTTNKISIAEHVKTNIRSEMVQACLNVYRAKHKRLKLFSLTFVLITNSIAAYMIVGTILEYLKYEVSTNTRTIFQTPAPFPKVSFGVIVAVVVVVA